MGDNKFRKCLFIFMSFPQFDTKDWEDIIAYRKQYDDWVHENRENLPAGLTYGNELAFTTTAMVISSLALLKTQNDLEKLENEVAKSQKNVEFLTLLLVFFTVSLLLYSFLGSGAMNASLAIGGGGLVTAVPFAIWKFCINVE